jgi:general secretion pathway protein K
LSVSEANTMVVRRKQAAYLTAQQFVDETHGKVAAVTEGLGVKSDWYLVNSRIRLDRAALDAESLIRRGGSGPMTGPGGTRVVWIRQY